MKKYIIGILSLLLVAGVSCDRYVDSKDPLRSLPEVGPAPANLEVFVNDQTVTLDWDIADSASISGYRVYVGDSTASNYRLYDSSSVSRIILSGLVINRLYYFQVSAIGPGGLEGLRSEAVSARPGYLSISIRSGAEYTTSRDVQIQIGTTAGTSHIMLSEDSTFADANFEAFSSVKSFTLSYEDGLKTVYARLQFSDGSQSGEPIYDDITLDTRAFIDSVFFRPPGLTFAPGDTILFGVDGGEIYGQARVSFTNVSRLDLYDDGVGGDAVAHDGIYSGRYIVPNNTNVYNGVVTGNFSDAAGNAATAVTASVYLDINTPPDTVELIAYIDGDSTRFNWTAAIDQDFESYRIYQETTAAVDTNSTLIQYLASRSSISFATGVVSGAVYYRIYVFDQHGLAAGSNVVSVVGP